MNPVKQLNRHGQSIWLDDIRRKWMTTGELKRLIEKDGVRGMTSNPAIFEKAIAGSPDYDDDIRAMALAGRNATEIYEAICIRDVQSASDEFRPLYDASGHLDGFVSLEGNGNGNGSPIRAHGQQQNVFPSRFCSSGFTTD